MTFVRAWVFPVLLLGACRQPLDAADPGKDAPAVPKEVSYYRAVRPIFVQHCQGCHQPAKQGGSFVMTGHADLLKTGDKGEPGVVPGKPDKSLIVEQITAHDAKPPAMPKGKDPLIDYQIT